MADILNYEACIDNKTTTLDIAIRHYVKSVIYAIENENEKMISFPEKIRKINE